MADADAVFEAVASESGAIRDALSERRAHAEGANPTGDRQLAADVFADERLEARLLGLDAIASYASEEQQAASPAPDGGSLHVACDPLDGSSNLESNNVMGTILGVYDEPLPAGGDALVAAGYVLYGPITTMVTAVDDTVTEYLLEDGQRTVLTDDVTLPPDPTVYGFGGRVPDWPEPFETYVDDVEADRLKLRYGGAMVGDVNQVLSYGGIFGYPMLADAPDGKLRLQFEGHPIAHVIETAGGASTDGTTSLLARTPARLHERSPVFVGNAGLIDRLEAALGQ
jgi:fructose-1,6-bisphosphatase I